MDALEAMHLQEMDLHSFDSDDELFDSDDDEEDGWVRSPPRRGTNGASSSSQQAAPGARCVGGAGLAEKQTRTVVTHERALELLEAVSVWSVDPSSGNGKLNWCAVSVTAGRARHGKGTWTGRRLWLTLTRAVPHPARHDSASRHHPSRRHPGEQQLQQEQRLGREVQHQVGGRASPPCPRCVYIQRRLRFGMPKSVA